MCINVFIHTALPRSDDKKTRFARANYLLRIQIQQLALLVARNDEMNYPKHSLDPATTRIRNKTALP
jgi:hypothetical protein